MSLQTFAYTDAGMALLLAAATGSRLTITKAVCSTGLVDPDALASQTDVFGEQHACELLGIKAVGEGDTAARKVPVRITGAQASYTLHQVGLYGSLDGAVRDTLILLAQDERGVEIPSALQDSEFEIIFNILIAISRDAKIALALNADMRGLKQFIRQEIHDNTAHARIVDITIPINAWKQEIAAAEYGYVAKIPIQDATAEQSPTVTIHREHTATAQAAALCPMAETDSGVLILWVKHVPRTDMTATVLLVSPKSVNTLEPLPDEPTDTTTTARLGTAALGMMILGRS